ncbi:MAG: hypothetical protein KBH07_09820 [Flavobacteriales bacterium]|nr:hypothetical protein [Flavobacteriales bacterium]MBP9081218.1 hypothetical protein [Flavobacteriales bacterium]
MITTTGRTTLLVSTLLLLPCLLQAQKLVDHRDQATGWYVPVKVVVTTGGVAADKVDVQVYKENKLIHEIPSSKNKFTVNMDLENTYTLVVAKEGYRTKSVLVHTHVPDDQVEYPEYACALDLEPADRFTHSDPFYLDFPGAIVRWDERSQAFVPQLNYLADIQSKVAMLRAQMDIH